MSLLQLTLTQPAQIGRAPRKDTVTTTERHIPGAVVRGAFAAAWIARHGEPVPGSPGRARFLDLFEGGIRFGPLFAGHGPLPLSVMTHKYSPGPTCEPDIDEADGPDAVRCPTCRAGLEYVRELRDAPAAHRRTNVAIGAAQVATRGMLVTRETLHTGTVLRGHLVTDDPGLREDLTGLGPIRIGGRRTTHGAATVTILDCAVAGPEPRDEDPTVLVLRLRSPGVFVDDAGRPQLCPNKQELATVLQVPDVRIERRWVRWTQIGGWHAASGLPKPTELAAAAGSTYQIRCAAPVDHQALRRLARRGVGLRRHEGFGDLDGPPALAVGDATRRALADRCAALRQITRSPAWPRVLDLMRRHTANEDTASTALAALRLPAAPAAAVQRFLAMPPHHAAAALAEIETW